VLVDPLVGVAFGIQKGRGAKHETVLVQLGGRADLRFDLSLELKSSSGTPNFVGPFAQGPSNDRFVYVGVGTFAGQKDSVWSRRMKIPLSGITKTLVREVLSKPGHRLVARIPGTGRDGTPSCATTNTLDEWKIVP
jgi:hypothetical protein